MIKQLLKDKDEDGFKFVMVKKQRTAKQNEHKSNKEKSRSLPKV